MYEFLDVISWVSCPCRHVSCPAANKIDVISLKKYIGRISYIQYVGQRLGTPLWTTWWIRFFHYYQQSCLQSERLFWPLQASDHIYHCYIAQKNGIKGEIVEVVCIVSHLKNVLPLAQPAISGNCFVAIRQYLHWNSFYLSCITVTVLLPYRIAIW